VLFWRGSTCASANRREIELAERKASSWSASVKERTADLKPSNQAWMDEIREARERGRRELKATQRELISVRAKLGVLRPNVPPA